MTLSETNKRNLAILRDIYDVSGLCSTRTYVWAGLVQDILAGKFLREHRDVDGFTLNLWGVRYEMAALYEQRGYAISFLDDVHILRIDRDGVHAVFNRLEFDGETAMWRHAGDEGTVYFPKQWLSDTPQCFYDTRVFVSGIEFEYSIKTHPHLLNPEWAGRTKDADALKWLNSMLDEQQIDREGILRQIWSYNPYWVKRGYRAYTMPFVAWKLEPKE